MKAVLDECELNGTYDKELKKMEDEIEIKEMISNVHEALEGRYELSGYDLHTIHYFLCEFDSLFYKPDVINSAKIKVRIAGTGTIDKCDHCGTEFTTGVACWKVDEWKSLDLCHICLKKYYDKSK